MSESQLFKELEEAEEDIKSGRVGDIEDLFTNVRNALAKFEAQSDRNRPTQGKAR